MEGGFINQRLGNVLNTVGGGIGNIAERIDSRGSGVRRDLLKSAEERDKLIPNDVLDTKPPKTAMSKLVGSAVIPNNSGAALAMHPTARILTIRGLVADILMKNLQITADKVELLLYPITAVLRLNTYDNILDVDTMSNMRQRVMLDSLLEMGPQNLDVTMGEVTRIRRGLADGTKKVFSVNNGRLLDNWRAISSQIRSNMFGDMDKRFSFVSNMVPDAISGLFELDDLYSDVESRIESVYGQGISRYQCYHMLNILSDDSGAAYSSPPEPRHSPHDPYNPGTINDDFVVGLPYPDCDVCVRPLVDVARAMVELIVSTKELAVQMVTLLPGMAVDSCILLLHLSQEIANDVLVAKRAVIRAFANLSLDVVEGILSFSAFAPIYDCDPYDSEVIDRLPLNMKLYPGGLPVFQSILVELRSIHQFYVNLIHGFHLSPHKFDTREFSDLMDYLIRRSDGSACMQGLCFEDFTNWTE